MTVPRLELEARSLHARVRDFSPARWSARALEGPGTRADALYGLIVTLAALGRRAGSGAPPQATPPRLGDHALADQLAVMVADLVASPGLAEVESDALAAVLAARAAVDGTRLPPTHAGSLSR
ncbi:MAG: hypothetical protein ACYDB7_06120 [Mycobacteriales bacterium]